METVTGEVLNINNEYRSYKEYKAAVDNELQKTSESFVRIGYLLKVARDTDILKGSGYGSVNEFAYAEYNLDRSQVSRFININDQFSEDGYSDRLQEKYRDFGYAKLALMLLLPDTVREEISAGFSKSEIQEIKEEIDEEKKITDIEVMLEGQDRQQGLMDSNLLRVMHQLLHEQPELYLQIHECIRSGGFPAGMKDILAPSGENVYSVRIPGTGRMMIFLRETGEEIPVTNIRSGEKEVYTWQQVYEALTGMFRTDLPPKEAWEKAYGEGFPVKETAKPEVAPVQQRKQNRVMKAKVENEKDREKESRAEPERKEEAAGHSGKAHGEAGEEKEHGSDQDNGERQVLGQIDITQYPDVVPERESEETVQEKPEQTAEDNYTKHMEELKGCLDSAYQAAGRKEYLDAEIWLDRARAVLDEMAHL